MAKRNPKAKATGKGNFLAVFGHTNMDYIIDLPKLPERDTSVQMIDGRQFFGGVAGNIARMAASLGVPTGLVSWVGNNFAEEYLRALQESGVDLSAFTRLSGYFTPTCWIMTDREQNQFSIINQGPMKDLPTFDVRTDAIDKASHVHFTTGLPAHYLRAVAYAKKKGKTIGIDPAQEIHYSYSKEMLEPLIASTRYLFCNRSESKVMCSLLGLEDIDALAERVPVLINTLGKEGSIIRTEGEAIGVPIVPPARVVDPTGAGDGYRAGFYAGLHRGLDLADAGLLGATVSSFVVEERGPQGKIPTWEEVWNRFEKAKRSAGPAPKARESRSRARKR